MDLGDEEARRRYEGLQKRVRAPAGGAWERDGEQLRESLRLGWDLWVRELSGPTSVQEEFLGRCMSLLTRENLGKQSENLDLLASLLARAPANLSDPLRNSLKGAVGLLLDQQVPTATARKLLAQAAEREEDFGFGHVLYFALAGLPHSLGLLAKRLPTATTGKPDLTVNYQRLLLTCQDKDCLEDAFRLLYLGPGTQWAVAALNALEPALAPDEAWRGVGRAALERPRLQPPLMARLLESPRPSLNPLVAWIWVYGAPSAHAAAGKILLRDGTAAELPILEQQVPPSTAILEACRAREKSASDFSLAQAAPPWTAEDRVLVAALIGGAPAEPAPLQSLRDLGKSPSVATVDLLLELVESLAHRLGEPPIFEVFLTHCLQAQSRRLLEGLATALVQAVGTGARVPGAQRALLAARAKEVVDGHDSSLALARLALPDSLAHWREQRQKHLRATTIPVEDQELACALLPLELKPLQVVYEDATPNQRRLLLARAPFARFPAAAPALMRWLIHEDPSSLPVFLEQLLKEQPEGLLGLLADLTGQDLPDPVRQAAVLALGERGGREELILLGSLKDVDTTAARAAILKRLSAQGQNLDGGGLEVAVAGGELVAAEGGTAPPPPPSPAAPKDSRKRLLPPPRPLSPLLLLSYLVLAPNGWGLIWTNVLLAMTVFGSYARDLDVPKMVVGSLPFFINHALCRSDQELRCLRRGVLLAATVNVETRLIRGKNPKTQWLHRLQLLGDDGRLHQHTLVDGQRRDELLDEKHELVLAVLDSTGAPGAVRAMDAMRWVEVDNRGFFRLRRRTWGLLLLSTLPWWPLLYDALT